VAEALGITPIRAEAAEVAAVAEVLRRYSHLRSITQGLSDLMEAPVGQGDLQRWVIAAEVAEAAEAAGVSYTSFTPPLFLLVLYKSTEAQEALEG
jgi:hypothetical protein